MKLSSEGRERGKKNRARKDGKGERGEEEREEKDEGGVGGKEAGRRKAGEKKILKFPTGAVEPRFHERQL